MRDWDDITKKIEKLEAIQVNVRKHVRKLKLLVARCKMQENIFGEGHGTISWTRTTLSGAAAVRLENDDGKSAVYPLALMPDVILEDISEQHGDTDAMKILKERKLRERREYKVVQ